MKQVDVGKTKMRGSESDHHLNKTERSTNTNERFSQWVRKHKVCFEVSPLILLNNFTKCQIGFMLNLYAQHPDSDNRHLTPKDKDWMEMYVELEEIVKYCRTSGQIAL